MLYVKISLKKSFDDMKTLLAELRDVSYSFYQLADVARIGETETFTCVRDKLAQLAEDPLSTAEFYTRGETSFGYQTGSGINQYWFTVCDGKYEIEWLADTTKFTVLSPKVESWERGIKSIDVYAENEEYHEERPEALGDSSAQHFLAKAANAEFKSGSAKDNMDEVLATYNSDPEYWGIVYVGKFYAVPAAVVETAGLYSGLHIPTFKKRIGKRELLRTFVSSIVTRTYCQCF